MCQTEERNSYNLKTRLLLTFLRIEPRGGLGRGIAPCKKTFQMESFFCHGLIGKTQGLKAKRPKCCVVALCCVWMLHFRSQETRYPRGLLRCCTSNVPFGGGREVKSPSRPVRSDLTGSHTSSQVDLTGKTSKIINVYKGPHRFTGKKEYDGIYPLVCLFRAFVSIRCASDVQPYAPNVRECASVQWDGLGRLGTGKNAKSTMFMRVGTVGRPPWREPTHSPDFISGRPLAQPICLPQTFTTAPRRRNEAPWPVSRRLTSPSAPAQSAERGL